MPNMARVISTHNSKIYTNKLDEENQEKRNLQEQNLQQKIKQNLQQPQTRARKRIWFLFLKASLKEKIIINVHSLSP